jgi:3-oxoacyl-[acyl-carrier-protein] synthase II
MPLLLLPKIKATDLNHEPLLKAYYMNIAGIGIISTIGRGIDSLDIALRQGWIAPSQTKSRSNDKNVFYPAYRVNKETINDITILKKIRRADRFSKMAVMAAWDAVIDSGIQINHKESEVGIILATAFGPHVTTFRFLDDIIDYGDGSVSPTAFSHSVHNAAASYISSLLNIRGPTVTITQFASPIHQSLILAKAWLTEKRCKYVLIGCVDVCGNVMEYICNQKLRIANDGKIRPFNFSASPSAVPGEGSVFFMTTLENCQNKYCEIIPAYITNCDTIEKSNINIIEADGMVGDETSYQNTVPVDVFAGGYSPIFGSMKIISAFHCTASALMLKKQIRYACPVQDNPYDLNLITKTESAEIKQICCIRKNCANKTDIIKLIR